MIDIRDHYDALSKHLSKLLVPFLPFFHNFCAAELQPLAYIGVDISCSGVVCICLWTVSG